MTLDSSREWRDDEEENEGKEILDAFDICRGKVFNILCISQPELAMQVESSDMLKDENRVVFGILFDDETFNCSLSTRVILSSKKISEQRKPFGRLGESRMQAAELDEEVVMTALKFIQEELREALVRYLEDQRDRIVADVETELQRWDKRQYVIDQMQQICDTIMGLPYL